MKSKLAIFIVGLVYVCIVYDIGKWKSNIFEWDKSGYYLYLPAVFIYHDLGRFEFYPEVNAQYNLSRNDDRYALYEQAATGRRVNKYAIGVSILQAPFFLAGHFITKVTDAYPADGYSLYYRLAIILGGIFYVLCGLWALRKLLLPLFGDKITAFSLLLIALGTNLYNYTAFDYAMSHPYSFFLFAVFILASAEYGRKAQLKQGVMAMVTLGLIAVTRPTNALVLIAGLPLFLFPVYPVAQPPVWRQHWRNLLPMALCFAAVVMIQLGYWKFATGEWVHFSYEEEGFNFGSPEIFRGLFSYRKGWFVYTPLALLAVIGILTLVRRRPVHAMAIGLFLILHVYVTFSWHAWHYGGGFGSRPMVEVMAVLILPLASLLDSVRRMRRRVVTTVLVCVTSLCMVLNIFQTYQFYLGIIPWDHTNKAYYWRIFGKLERTDEDWQLLNFDE